MKINGINGKILFPEESSGKKPGKVSDKKDRVEISSEAIEIYRMKRMEKIEEIKRRIQSGYYDSKEVLEKVVDEIYKQIKSELR
ncbi:Anti-sigma-28 factor, FlgM [Candidatus Thermokryptus mobilis]|uniref:Anti-sigma-28 factor, FlgM n=1 Tax=Candidatus Thermokryptus mobilis TaxID=1643428 RepID=A0A0S4N521_9BACT|nr:flagellar biosynthesis anti-sigma factor FlgM [Candidatus Thermokryptus mobilis]CUU05105.1 Anti-sigma-28 factor, FlgM [Candidatus Thermokryptus mobilis]